MPELSRHVWHLCQNLKEVLEKLGKPQKNGQKLADLLCFAQIYIVQIQNDMATIFPFKHAFLKVSFRPSGIEGQNEPFKRSVVAKLMEWHWFLSCRVTLRENRGKFPIFEKSPKTEQKIFFLKILKSTHPKIRSKATQKRY